MINLGKKLNEGFKKEIFTKIWNKIRKILDTFDKTLRYLELFLIIVLLVFIALKPNLSTHEKISIVYDWVKPINTDPDGGYTKGVSTQAITVPCSNINDWLPDENINFENNLIKLVKDSKAGTITFTKPMNYLSKVELVFKSELNTGVNTNFALKSGGDELKYAIGDGDFQTVRYSFNNADSPKQNPEEYITKEIMDNKKQKVFVLDILERSESYEAVSTLKYSNSNGEERVEDLRNLPFRKPDKIYANIILGIDRRREIDNQDAYLEIISCTITEKSSSRYLNS